MILRDEVSSMPGLMVATRGGLSPRLLAALSYMGVLCLVPLFLNRNDEFVAFHTRQGLVLWIWAILAILALLLPGVGVVIFRVSFFVIPVFSVVGMIAVVLHRAWTLPWVYGLSCRI
ncbi:MAG: hypothetical protein ABT940_00855 [Alphaproteobacteria bacterium]